MRCSWRRWIHGFQASMRVIGIRDSIRVIKQVIRRLVVERLQDTQCYLFLVFSAKCGRSSVILKGTRDKRDVELRRVSQIAGNTSRWTMAGC